MHKYLNKIIPTPIAIGIILISTILIGGFTYWQYIEMQKEETENVVCNQETKLCPDSSYVNRISPNCDFAECPADNLSCKEGSKYFVISKESEPGVSDFLVKLKISSDQIIPCSYVVDKADFELKNQEATYFLALADNFLILDMGTAPSPRVFIVYDLSSRKEVYIDNYSHYPSDSIKVLNDTITYWSPINEKVTNDNCPKLDEFLTGGLGAGIEAYVSLNLSDLTKKELGEYRCSSRQ